MGEGKQVTKEYTGESRFRPIYAVIAAAVLLAVIIGVVIWIVHRNDRRTYVAYDEVIKKQLTFSSVSGMLPIRDGVLRYARDGVEVVDLKGETMWNVSYNMANPMAATCGRYAAVGDVGGVVLYLLDGSGTARSITTTHPIVKVAVSGNGETAVMLDGGQEDFIMIYHADGTLATEINTISAVNGFPVDVAISEDGTKVVVSFTYFDEDEIRSRLTFYNFGDIGRNYSEGHVGKAESVETRFADNLYADVEFITNDCVAVFGDKSFILYEMEEIPRIQNPVEIPYSGEVRRFAHNGKYVGFLMENHEEGHIEYVVNLYDLKGKLVETRKLDSYYSGFRIEGGDVMLYSDTSLYIYRIKGKDKFRSSTQQPLSIVLATEQSNGFVFISDNQFNRVRLIGGE